MRSEDIRKRLKDIDEFLLNQYKESKKIEKRDWRTYEQQLTNRIKEAIRNLEPLINEATNIKIHRGSGRPPSLDLKQRGLMKFSQQKENFMKQRKTFRILKFTDFL